MVNSIYSPSGVNRISSVNTYGVVKNRASLQVVQSDYAPVRSYGAQVASTGGNYTAVAAIAGRSIVVDNYVIVASGASSIKFLSNSTDLTGSMMIGGSGDISSNSTLMTAQGQALVINSSSAIAGNLTYRIV